jgi:hypothetical protein
MLTVNWKHVLLTGGALGGHRVKRPGGGSPPLVIAQGTDTGVVRDGLEHWKHDAPLSIIDPSDNKRYVFAFWSRKASPVPSLFEPIVTGRSIDTQCDPSVRIDVEATAWYVWDFGSGPGSHAIFFDAFDVDLGDFIADDFVDVTPDDAKRSLTTIANDNGTVSTDPIPSPEITVTARHELRGAIKKSFSRWFEIDVLTHSDPGPPEPIVKDDRIVAHANDIVVAIAFYTEPRAIPLPDYRIFNPWWWFETAGGRLPHVPIGPPDWLWKYRAVAMLINTADQVSPVLKSAVLELAMKQLSTTTVALEKEIRQMLKRPEHR